MKSGLRVPPAAPDAALDELFRCCVRWHYESAFGGFTAHASKSDYEDFKVVNFCELRGCARQQFGIVLNSGHVDGWHASMVCFALYLNDFDEEVAMFGAGTDFFGGLKVLDHSKNEYLLLIYSRCSGFFFLLPQ